MIRQPFGAGDLLPFWAMTRFTGNHLHDRREDPDEERNLAGTKREAEMAEKLRVALIELEAPTTSSSASASPSRPVAFGRQRSIWALWRPNGVHGRLAQPG